MKRFGRRGKKKIYTLSEIAEIVKPIAESYGTGPVYVFGSYGRGEADEDSDIDFFVELGEIKSYFTLGGMYMDLKEALGCRIDVVPSGCDEAFVDCIRKDMVQVYGRGFLASSYDEKLLRIPR